jgi:CHASE3 domain sensor protein
MKVYFKGGVVAGFCLALLNIATLGVYPYLGIQQLIDTANAFSRRLRVTNLTESVLVTSIGLETGRGGFVIAGGTRSLEPYRMRGNRIKDQNFIFHYQIVSYE